MRFLSAAEVREQGARLTEEFRQRAAGEETGIALQNISRAIKEIQKVYPEVRFEIFGGASEHAFYQFSEAHVIAPISGILHIGHNQHLFSIATELDHKPALKIAFSMLDIRGQGALKDVRSDIFDLKNDPEALVSLQKDVLRHCARNQVVMENDVAGAFEKPEIPEQVKFATLKGLKS
jgi:hypothetical protein